MSFFSGLAGLFSSSETTFLQGTFGEFLSFVVLAFGSFFAALADAFK